jgi:AcrR family transcriptional regulator
MGLEAEKPAEAPARLIAAGRTLLAQGDTNFSLSRLCAEAGVTLADFRAGFASKAELMQQLMEPQKQEAPSVPVVGADPWLERRLRVFERALGALEDKAERRERETRQAIALLEERLAEIASVPAPVRAEPEEEIAPPAAPIEEAEPAEEKPNPLLLAPLEPEPLPRLDMEVLEQARRAALAHGRRLDRARARRHQVPTRVFVIAALAILLLLGCAALTLVWADYRPMTAGGAVAQRTMPASPVAQMLLRADSGEIAAQRALALAYLKGDGVQKDAEVAALWAQAAAGGGDAEAQYLLGVLSRSQPEKSFAWFARAAAAGHIKAMHALGIAYAQGQGVAQDEAQAAEWFAKAASRGFVDSAFNLAVLYERGHGVAQDPRQALRWYRAAAKAGDGVAAARAKLLAQQARL